MKYTDKAIYIPAVSIATHKVVMERDWLIKGKSARFYLKNKTKEEQLFHHPYLLSSAAHNFKNMEFSKEIGIKNIKKDVDIMFGDSGGFQIATKAIDNVTDDTLRKIYNWLETNTNVAPIIDVPPYTTGMTNIGMANMDKCLDDTIKNINILLKQKTDNDVCWLNVSHGRTYEQRNYWLNKVKDFDFYNGWAIGSLRKNEYIILSAFASLMDNKVLEDEKMKLIHFFGLTSLRFVPMMIYIKHKMNKKQIPINVSFDSSYATKDCAFGKYLTMMPDSSGFASYHLSNKEIGKFNPNAKFPCKCPICEDLKMGDVLNEKTLKSSGEYYFYNVVQSHNVMLMRDYIEKMNNIIDTECESFITSAFKASYIRTFKVIDKMFNAPTGKAMSVVEKYSSFLNVDEPEKDDQSTEESKVLFGDNFE